MERGSEEVGVKDCPAVFVHWVPPDPQHPRREVGGVLTEPGVVQTFSGAFRGNRSASGEGGTWHLPSECRLGAGTIDELESCARRSATAVGAVRKRVETPAPGVEVLFVTRREHRGLIVYVAAPGESAAVVCLEEGDMEELGIL